jgi:hypothetical protein
MERVMSLMTQPGAGLEPIRGAMRGRVNARYSTMPDTLATKTLAHGGARSGKFGTAMRQSEMGRLGELGDVESEIARMMLEQQERGAGLGERLLAQPFGATTSTSGTGSMTGTNIGPGSAVGGAVGGGLETLTTLMTLNKMLQGQGGGGGGGGDWSEVLSNVMGPR